MAKHYPKLSGILKKLLFDKDIKSVDLARAVDLPAPTVHRLVTGKSTRPYKSSLEPIADFFSVSVDQLLGEAPLEETKKQALTALPSVHTLPVIPWETLDDFCKNAFQIEKPPEEVLTAGSISDQSFGLVLNDCSMEPLFHRESLLLLDPQKTPIDRSYVLVKLAESNLYTFRQLLIDCTHRYLKPLNPDLSIYHMRLLSDADCVIACLFESRQYHPTATAS